MESTCTWWQNDVQKTISQSLQNPSQDRCVDPCQKVEMYPTLEESVTI
jgi:hypothetical protein